MVVQAQRVEAEAGGGSRGSWTMRRWRIIFETMPEASLRSRGGLGVISIRRGALRCDGESKRAPEDRGGRKVDINDVG